MMFNHDLLRQKDAGDRQVLDREDFLGLPPERLATALPP